MKFPVARLPWVGRLLQALGVNSVPAAGYFGEGWSIGTTLALYWLETVAVIVLISLRIVLHRRLTRRAGHWNIAVETRTKVGGRTSVRHGRTTFLVSFLAVMVPFTAAHGLFLGLLVFLVLPEHAKAPEGVALADLSAGAAAMALFLALGLVLDLVGLSERPFRWVERLAERAQGRMFVTHLTIIFGMGAMGVWGAPAALFAVFVGLKSLVDLGGLYPEREPRPEPPRWLAWLDGFGPARDGLTFSAHFRKAIEDERLKREANERPLDAGEAPA
ncbi:MAG: hypothetical protein F9K18_11695 [Thermoanaerobaculia bacterium]|nr:MAG: hypothetical protein F9K18_11695 [Thermoanaerobaculia bacterium]